MRIGFWDFYPIYAGLTAALIATSTPAQASYVENGRVSLLAVNSDNTVRVDVEGSRSALPSCAFTQAPSAFTFSLRQAGEQGMLAILISARSTGRVITIYGSSACTVTPSVESISTIKD